MSSRALRKAQREREEHERLQKLQQQDREAGNEIDDVPASPPRKSAFALLSQHEAEDGNDDDGDADRGAVVGGNEESAFAADPTTPSAPKPSAKKKKKKAKKTKTGGAVQDAASAEELDEIDMALKQLSTSNNGAYAGTTTARASEAVNETNRLLAIDTNHLHAQNEMRRLFGRAALDQQDDDHLPPNADIGGNRRQQRRVQHVGLAQALRGQGVPGGRSGGLAAMALRRNIFIQGKDEWPIATGGGLGMEIEQKQADGTVLYRFVHNRAYQDVQGQFEVCVESMDPNRLVMLLRHNPYHISTLLQVSEIAKQERDYATAGDLLERALFSFGRAVHSTFAKNLAEGKARLDFSRPENREFWLASWRYMQNLSMRATWRTVYEWAKLLLSLSPEEDPYALWLVLDQYALRSRQDLDFLNISRNLTLKEAHRGMPNVQLGQGLAEYRAGNQGKGKQALFTAVGLYPWVVARLMQELSIDPPPAVWGKEPRTEKEKLYSELYALRAKDLWNTPETCTLLTEVASALPMDRAPAEPDTGDIAQNEARHVLLSDTPALIALIPRRFTARMTSVSDPLPPENNNASYASSRFSGGEHAPSSSLGTAAENLRELQGLYGFFTNLFPWFRPTDNGPDEGAAGEIDGDAEEHARPSPEEIERRIRESGVDEDVIVERTQRMMQLQQQLMGEMTDEDGNLSAVAQGAEVEQRHAEDDGTDDTIRQHHARVEDAPDEEG